MTKRYREPVQVEERSEEPAAFCWRGRTYRVLAVLGHWREDAGYWTGGGVDVPQRDLWRVEAARPSASAPVPPRGVVAGGAAPAARSAAATVPAGVYELVREAGAWRLDRVWD